MAYFAAERTVPIPNKDISSWIFDNPPFDQDAPIYIDAKDSSRSISLNQARSLIRKLIAGFHNAGLSLGDCVCVHSFNDLYYSILFQGIVGSGGVFTGTNPGYTEFELNHHLKTSKARFMITEPEMLPVALKAVTAQGIPKSNIWIFDTLGQDIPDGFLSWKALLEHGERDWRRFDDEKTSKSTTAARLFSSGTTGLPKAAVLSHYNLVAQHTLTYELNVKPWTSRRLVALPMFHAACVPVAHVTSLKSGTTSVIMRRFDLEPFLAAIQNFQITEMLLVPPIVIAIIMSGLGEKYSLKSVRSVAIGAAPLGKDSQDKLKTLLDPRTTVTQVWGMTEASCVVTMFYYPEDDDTGSVGRLMPNLEAKLVDPDGKDISAYDVRGEMCIRGPTIISGYFENPTANASGFDKDGFYRTGDIMYCSRASKKWYIVDRAKELIKVRAFQVAPPELETVLLTHPLIVDAAVIGVSSKTERDVELIRAYVVKRQVREAEGLGEEEVRKWCGDRLAKYKDLTGGVRFVDSIPKNASGKILKRLLREEAEREGKGKL